VRTQLAFSALHAFLTNYARIGGVSAGGHEVSVHRLRVLSANLWNGGADPVGFAAVVEELRPDIVAVQELTPPQADALAAVMPHGSLEPAEGFMGMGIALRQPSSVVRLPLPYRDAQVAKVTIGRDGNNRTIEVINVHVRAPHNLPHPRGARDRRGQLQGLMRYIAEVPDQVRIVLGDFNATPMWPLYRRVAARMTDAAVDAARRNGGRTSATWGPWPGAPRLLRIDHIFVTGMSTEHFRVVAVPGGDHSAVVADLTIDE
jgi:endonuclease/exonuclease/phosphatase family metal-dependent hydrolase